MVRSLANYPDVGHQISGLEHGVEKRTQNTGNSIFHSIFHILTN